MNVETRVEPLEGTLPTVQWRWDVETDILSGGFRGVVGTDGLEGSVELSDEEGSVVVLDVAGGVVCGLDVVVWPEVDTVPGLAPPAGARTGRVVVPGRPARQGVSAVEVDTTLTVSATPDERTVHLRIGSRREVEVIRVADHLLVELDHKRRLAGFWLTEVPPFAPL
jgi:hypothetical protein